MVRSRAVAVALVVDLAVGVAVGWSTARAVAEPSTPARSPGWPAVSAGDQPDVLGAATDSLYALLEGFARAREEAAAPLVELGWTPDVCEPVVDGVPKVTSAPPCEPITPSVEHWLAVNRCEQGGDWHAYGVFGNGLVGGGGLGISDGAWREWGGLQFAPTAAGATPFEQIVVASRGYRLHGPGAWGCP